MAETALAPPPRRRGLSLTPLIDVIFLLLLFFMLATSFSRQTELDLTASGAGVPATGAAPPLFVQLGAETLSLNGTVLAFDMLPAALAGVTREAEPPASVLISLSDTVASQRLVDLLVVLRGAGHPAVVLQ